MIGVKKKNENAACCFWLHASWGRKHMWWRSRGEGGDDEGCRTEIKILLRDYEPSHPGKCEKFQSECEWNLRLTLSWFDALRRLIASLSERFWAVSNSFNHLSRAERTVSPISLPSPPPLSLPLFLKGRTNNWSLRTISINNPSFAPLCPGETGS